MDDDTLVAVWNSEQAAFVSVLAGLVVCHECGADAHKAPAAFWWDGPSWEPFLVCECGEQFFRWEEGAN